MRIALAVPLAGQNRGYAQLAAIFRVNFSGFSRIAACQYSTPSDSEGEPTLSLRFGSGRYRSRYCTSRLCASHEARGVAGSNFVYIWLFGADADAGGEVAGFDFDERRLDIAASGNCIRAASVKTASMRRIDG